MKGVGAPQAEPSREVEATASVVDFDEYDSLLRLGYVLGFAAGRRRTGSGHKRGTIRIAGNLSRAGRPDRPESSWGRTPTSSYRTP
jgi:hypothetical protein